MIVWPRHSLAAELGLNRSPVAPKNPNLKVGRADIDPVSGGITGILSGAKTDDHGCINDIECLYFHHNPDGDGQLIPTYLIEVDLSPIADDPDHVAINEVYFRGKPLGIEDHDKPEELLAYVSLIFNAIRQINRHLRDGGPTTDILNILLDNNLGQAFGEGINLPGQDQGGNFDFPLRSLYNAASMENAPITFSAPKPDMIRLVAGKPVNTLDPQQQIDHPRILFEANRQSGVTYRGVTKFEENCGDITAHTSLSPHIVPDGRHAVAIDDFIQVEFEMDEDVQSKWHLNNLKTLGYPVSSNRLQMMKNLGLNLRVQQDFTIDHYPRVMDHLAKYGLLDQLRATAPPPESGRFGMVSLLGNGQQHLIDGLGYDLGACKMVFNEWMDEDKGHQRVAACLDTGWMIPGEGSEWDGAIPDLITFLDDCDHFFFTHRHLDHIDGIIPYIRSGMMADKNLYGSPRLIRMLEIKMKNECKDRDNWPRLHSLNGEGIIDICDECDIPRLRVEYSVDAVDHSTPSTPYRVVGCKGREPEDVIGSYLFYGDGRGIQPEKTDFFSRGLTNFGHPDRCDTLADYDTTSAALRGYNATEEEVGDNLIFLHKIFNEELIINSIISTQDGRLNSLYRVANETGRNFTGIGSNVEQTLTAHNVEGVSPEFIEAVDGDNINHHLQTNAKKHNEELWTRLEKKLGPYDTLRGPFKKIFDEQFEERRLESPEYRTRTSKKAKSWRKDGTKFMLVVTGTQGSQIEFFSTTSKLARASGLLTADERIRHSGFDITSVESDWVVINSQTAIPRDKKIGTSDDDYIKSAYLLKNLANHRDPQLQQVQQLIQNWGATKLAGVVQAVKNGVVFYGFDEGAQERIIREFADHSDPNIILRTDDEGNLVVTGFPNHSSGHGHQMDIEDMANIIQADINHGTHNNREKHTDAFADICDRNGLNHPGRQFDDFEFLDIQMGKSPQHAQVSSMGHMPGGVMTVNHVREFGKYWGGEMKIRRITRWDADRAYAHGAFSPANSGQWTENLTLADQYNNERQGKDRRMPDRHQVRKPMPIRRYQGRVTPDPTQGPDKDEVSTVFSKQMEMVA